MDTTVETISINGIEYVKKGTGSKRIIVADRGWIFVGDMDTTVETISINGIEYVKKGTGSKRIIVADSWATARIMMTGV